MIGFAALRPALPILLGAALLLSLSMVFARVLASSSSR